MQYIIELIIIKNDKNIIILDNLKSIFINWPIAHIIISTISNMYVNCVSIKLTILFTSSLEFWTKSASELL